VVPVISLSYAHLVFIVVALIAFFWWFYKVALTRTVDRRIRNYQKDLLERHFEEVNEVYGKMRGFKHDFHNHVQVMEACLELGKYDEMAAYLSQLSEDLEEIDWIIRTGNLMLDSILNVKLTLAEKRGINVNARASVPEALTDRGGTIITDVELCTVIGNLMDNAIEGCLTLDDSEARFIRLLIRPMKRNLYIYVSNSYGGELRRIGDAYATTKEGHDHGFGIRSVDGIVAKYGGSVNRQSEPGVFATEILLPLGDTGPS
jgi:two-component system sensor histidine kinase AgrC